RLTAHLGCRGGAATPKGSLAWGKRPGFPPSPPPLCRTGLEVDPHHDPALGRPVDLGESGRGEDAGGADVDLVPADLLTGGRQDRIRLERPGTAGARVVDGSPDERIGEPAAPEAGAHEDAGDGPDAVVALVL